jgi:hypothetical protein
MKNWILILIPVALSVVPVVAQSSGFYKYQPLSEVKQFLQLTDSQLQTILTNNDEYNDGLPISKTASIRCNPRLRTRLESLH